MQINEKIAQIDKMLPYGSYTVISKKTGIPAGRIREFFQAKKKPRLETIKKIFPVAQEIVNEVEKTINI